MLIGLSLMFYFVLPQSCKTKSAAKATKSVAHDNETARRAAKLVDVEYRVLEPITDPAVAIAEGTEDAVWGLDGNRLSTSHYERGDAETALTASV